ncbi:MAG: hypothetical protein VYE73_15455 [Acidobacteriota bacterium]|nr:hypothetical protein [Acidobacteriota bacterium]
MLLTVLKLLLDAGPHSARLLKTLTALGVALLAAGGAGFLDLELTVGLMVGFRVLAGALAFAIVYTTDPLALDGRRPPSRH